MPEIEFVEDEDPAPRAHRMRPVADEDVASTGHRPGRVGVEAIRTWGPAVLVAVGATLALIAPWQTFYRLSAPLADVGFSYSFDGWGRLPGRVGDGGAHGTRYGVLMCIAAGLLVTGGALAVYGRLHRAARAASAGTGLTLTAIGLLGGATGTAWLEVSAQVDNVRVSQNMDAQGSPGYRVITGGMVWFGLAAVIAGLAAVVLPLVLRPRPTPEPEPESALPLALPVPERPRYVPHADDEQLDV